MNLRRLSLGIGSGLFDKIVVTVVQLLLVPVLANAWGLTLFGIWAMLATIPTMLALSDFGIITSAWARMTLFVSRGEVERARMVLHTAWLSSGLITLALVVLSGATLILLPAGILPNAPGLGDVDSRAALFMLIAYGLGTVLFRLNTVIFRAAGNVPLNLWCNTASYTIENVGVLIAVLLGAGIVTAAGVLLVARCISIVGVFVLGNIKYPELRPGFMQASRDEWVQMWRPALSAAVLGFGVIAFLQLSVLALGASAGAAAVPAFVAVRTLSRVGLQISQMVAGPVAQEFGQEMAGGRAERAGRYFGLVLATSLVMSVGIAFGMVVLGTTFVRLWTAGAIEVSFTLMLAMALSSAAAVLWNTVANLISSVNRQGAISNINLGASIVGLLLIAVTGDHLGAVAAGLAFAAVDLVTVVAVVRFVRQEWWISPEFRDGTCTTFQHLRNPAGMLRALRQRSG
ncbi:hypothetical protein V5740_01645 [Croceibacterium sp. TMG7-5b_MA50]|uniref:hypothetical protein n=1 Tax=Croceibacterium sp. TMG7-5b_MA50 TaxID=3121290 RepID=UPI003221E010